MLRFIYYPFIQFKNHSHFLKYIFTKFYVKVFFHTGRSSLNVHYQFLELSFNYCFQCWRSGEVHCKCVTLQKNTKIYTFKTSAPRTIFSFIILICSLCLSRSARILAAVSRLDFSVNGYLPRLFLVAHNSCISVSVFLATSVVKC